MLILTGSAIRLGSDHIDVGMLVLAAMFALITPVVAHRIGRLVYQEQRADGLMEPPTTWSPAAATEPDPISAGKSSGVAENANGSVTVNASSRMPAPTPGRLRRPGSTQRSTVRQGSTTSSARTPARSSLSFFSNRSIPVDGESTLDRQHQCDRQVAVGVVGVRGDEQVRLDDRIVGEYDVKGRRQQFCIVRARLERISTPGHHRPLMPPRCRAHENRR